MARVNFAALPAVATGRAALAQMQAAEVVQRNAIIAASTAPAPAAGLPSILILGVLALLAFHIFSRKK